MFPDIACAGPFCLSSLSVCLALAFFVSGFIFFRKVREEHYLEMEAFDGFLLSLIAGLIVGRLTYIAFHFEQFGFSLWKWFDVITYPGVVGVAALIGAGWYLFRYSKKFTDDNFELLDIWSISVAAGLSLVWLGLFLDGASMGHATTLPIGLRFPGLLEPHVPVQLLIALFFLLLALYLQWVEFRYRTYGWYRSGKKSAQSGFLISVSIISTSLLWVALSFLRPAQLLIAGIPIDTGLALVGVLVGIMLLYLRSGRKIGTSSEHRVYAG